MTECSQEIGYLQSINYDKHLPQLQVNFLDDDISNDLYESYLSKPPFHLNVYCYGPRVSETVKNGSQKTLQYHQRASIF
jgi:hypothetical protein